MAVDLITLDDRRSRDRDALPEILGGELQVGSVGGWDRRELPLSILHAERSNRHDAEHGARGREQRIVAAVDDVEQISDRTESLRVPVAILIVAKILTAPPLDSIAQFNPPQRLACLRCPPGLAQHAGHLAG